MYVQGVLSLLNINHVRQRCFTCNLASTFPMLPISVASGLTLSLTCSHSSRLFRQSNIRIRHRDSRSFRFLESPYKYPVDKPEVSQLSLFVFVVFAAVFIGGIRSMHMFQELDVFGLFRQSYSILLDVCMCIDDTGCFCVPVYYQCIPVW